MKTAVKIGIALVLGMGASLLTPRVALADPNCADECTDTGDCPKDGRKYSPIEGRPDKIRICDTRVVLRPDGPNGEPSSGSYFTCLHCGTVGCARTRVERTWEISDYKTDCWTRDKPEDWDEGNGGGDGGGNPGVTTAQLPNREDIQEGTWARCVKKGYNDTGEDCE